MIEDLCLGNLSLFLAEKLEREKQSRRLLSHENLQKTKSLLQGVEKRKEEEMLKWRQKRDSQKPRNSTAGQPTTLQLHSNHSFEGRGGQFQKKSNWTISECLKGYSDCHVEVKSTTDDQVSSCLKNKNIGC